MRFWPQKTKSYEAPWLRNDSGEELTLPDFLTQFLNGATAFAAETCGREDLVDAWSTFKVWLNSEIDYRAQDWELFLTWYVFHWHSPTNEAIQSRRDSLIAEKYARHLGPRLSDQQRNLIASAIDSPMDFYEIYRLPEWNCFYIKSLFLGQASSFAFSELPEGLTEHDIFFGKIIPKSDDQGLLAAFSIPFEPSAKVPIVRLRQDLIGERKADFYLNFTLFDSDVFNLYHDLLQNAGFNNSENRLL